MNGPRHLRSPQPRLDQDRKLIQLARDGSVETQVIEHGKHALAHDRAAQHHIEGTRNPDARDFQDLIRKRALLIIQLLQF